VQASSERFNAPADNEANHRAPTFSGRPLWSE